MLRTAITVSRARPLLLRPRLPQARAISVTPRRFQSRYQRSEDDSTGDEPNPKQTARSILNLKTLVGAGIGLAGCHYYVSHLEEVPHTGRRRFMVFGETWDSKISEEARNQILSEYGNQLLPPNHRISKRVRRIVTKILDANKLGSIKGEVSSSPLGSGDIGNPDEAIQKASSREWEVIVIDEKRVVNALATPGTIVVFTGILPICQDDDGLAAFLAHEVGHVVARHVPENLSYATLAHVAIFAISTITGVDFGLSRRVHDLLFTLPHSRAQELEADAIGLILMSRACYDPKTAPEAFQRLGELEKLAGNSSFHFFNTHPSSESRVEALENKVPDAYAVRAANPDCTNSLTRFKNAFLRGVGDRGFWS